jgi:GntR family transcriptional repressor for pyruvate dehydrogenase complex
MAHDAALLDVRSHAAGAVGSLIESMKSNIASGEWQPGFRLPTERELEIEFGVARNTIRKGLKKLEDAGQIVRHVGRGSFVADRTPAVEEASSLLSRVVGSSPAEVMEIRLAIEPWATSLAASRGTSADLASLRECVDEAEAAPDVPTFETWDGKLHERIIAATKNELLKGLYEAINLARNQPEWMKLKERTVTRERRDLYQRQHRAIVGALLDRDAETAGRLMREHLSDVRVALVGI